MRIIIIVLSLLGLVNGYTFPRTLSMIRNNSQLDFYKNKIKKLEKVKQEILMLSKQKLKEILEEEYATEWDYHNQTYK